jgi:hypothetical protein
MAQQAKKKLLIEQVGRLSSGEIILKGTKKNEDLKDLQMVLIEAFPKDKSICTGGWDYYMADPSDKKYWAWSKTDNGLLVVPLKDFFKE